ncbi:hypothetical protein AB0230_06950 [Microbacterium sp. NPDC089190]|uniref:hypothetical protein n=1 Tax=Microbacterium sp. NPDC089190 TaxID=3155063 RepID=UPI00344F16D4
MSKTTIATQTPCTDSRCRETVHTGTEFEHIAGEVKTERWEISVFRFVDPEVMDQEFALWVKIEDALMGDEVAEFVNDLSRLAEVCRLANLCGAFEVVS